MLSSAGVPARYVPVPYYAAGEAGLPLVSKAAHFLPHTLSGLGLRKLLARARAIGEPFTIEYARMESPAAAEGDETWRSTAGVKVRLSENPRDGTRSCHRMSRGGVAWPLEALWRADECSARELALISQPSRHTWMTHWLMPMPNPLVEPMGEMHCVSIS